MVGGGYCRLQMPLKLALAVRQWLGIEGASRAVRTVRARGAS